MLHKLLILGALPAVLAGVPHRGKHSTTKTVYSTSIATVTECPPAKTDCPAHKGPVVVTKVIPAYTTVCVEDDDDYPTSTAKPKGCSTSTKYKDYVYKTTSTKKPFPVTTKVPVTTITKKYYETEYKTKTYTVTTKDKYYKPTTITITTTYPTATNVKYSTSTSYSDCVHTVTNATVVYEKTKTVPAATYTVCPYDKPTGKPDFDYPSKPTGKPDYDHPSKPTGKPDYDYPSKPDYDHGVKPSLDYPSYVPKPTGSYTAKPAPIVTAGAANFGASLQMLGAAAAAAVLVL